MVSDLNLPRAQDAADPRYAVQPESVEPGGDARPALRWLHLLSRPSLGLHFLIIFFLNQNGNWFVNQLLNDF